MPWPWKSISGPQTAAATSGRAVPALAGCGERGGTALLVCLAAVLATGAAPAQVLLPVEDPPQPVYRVGRLELVYARPHRDQPPLDDLMPIDVVLVRRDAGWAAPVEDEVGEILSLGGPESPVVDLEPSGLARLMRGVVTAIHETGIFGIDVRPAPGHIDPVSESDLRAEGITTLQAVVTVGRVQQVRTVAVGDRFKGDWKIDHELHERIRRRSPLQPVGTSSEDTTDLIDQRKLRDYLYRLNRHSGRRVEAALAPAGEPGGVTLDYRVIEAKPWFAYAQTSNTGTRRTNRWQTRLGVVHRQLTSRDDILSLEYLNAGWDDVNGFRARYQAPWFGPERPDWMNRRKGDPDWLNALPREKVPWWGLDRLRWEADFSFGRFEAGRNRTFGNVLNDEVVTEQIQSSGRFIYETFQHQNFFVDLWGGFRLRNVEITNETGAGKGEQLFAIPRAGIHAERISQVSLLNIDFSAEGSVGSTSDDDIERLGRPDADGEYALLEWSAGYSTFLEPLLFPAAFRDPETEQTSTLAHEVALAFNGQYGFDYRLVPQATQIVGGLYSVRGYDQSVAVGDTVLVGTFEYRFHIPRALPVTREPSRIPVFGDFRAAPQQVYGRPDWDLILRAFVDVGQAIRNRNRSTAGPPEPDQTLIGAGVGTELQIRSNLRARVDWAVALSDTSEQISNPSEVGDHELHFLFSILY